MEEVLGHIERLRKTDARAAVEVVFGNEDTQAGTARTAARAMLLQPVKEILPAAKNLPGGFEVYRPPHDGLLGGTARGAGGVLIQGQYYYISCWDDYWTMQSPEEMRSGQEPVRHYEPAEIESENMGIIKVQAKKSSRSDLAKVLREVAKFLEHDASDEVTITWG